MTGVSNCNARELRKPQPCALATSTRHRSANGRMRSRLVTLTGISTRSRVLRRVGLGECTSIGRELLSGVMPGSPCYCVRFIAVRDGDESNRSRRGAVLRKCRTMKIKLRVPSGAEARMFGGFSGTTEVVPFPFPKPFLPKPFLPEPFLPEPLLPKPFMRASQRLGRMQLGYSDPRHRRFWLTYGPSGRLCRPSG